MFDSALAFAPAGAVEPGADGILPCEARGLVYEAGGKRLVDRVDIDLAGSGVTVVMGPNGAGKSLLLRLLHGVLVPTAGTVRWGGRPIDETIRRRQAMVFQRPVLLRRSVAANIRFVLRLRRRIDGDRDAVVRRILEQAGLVAFAHRPARVLSGGEQHRLAVARALALEPEVLFLDEPTASLDPASTHMVEEFILAIEADGTKIILVTHDIGQTKRLADDVVFVSHGRIAEHQSASSFFAKPKSEAARAYLEGRLDLSPPVHPRP